MACIFVQHVVDHTNTKCTQTKIATSAQSCIGIHPNMIQTCINKSIHRLLAMCTTNYDNAARIYFFQHTCQSHIECIGLRCPRLPTCGSYRLHRRRPAVVRMSLTNLNDTRPCSQRACNQLHKLTKAANRQLASFYVCFETRAKAHRRWPEQKKRVKQSFEFLSRVTPKTVQSDSKVLSTSSPK